MRGENALLSSTLSRAVLVKSGSKVGRMALPVWVFALTEAVARPQRSPRLSVTRSHEIVSPTYAPEYLAPADALSLPTNTSAFMFG